MNPMKYLSIKNRSFYQIILILLGGGLLYFSGALILSGPDMGLVLTFFVALVMLKKGLAPKKEHNKKKKTKLYEDILDTDK